MIQSYLVVIGVFLDYVGNEVVELVLSLFVVDFAILMLVYCASYVDSISELVVNGYVESPIWLTTLLYVSMF